MLKRDHNSQLHDDTKWHLPPHPLAWYDKYSCLSLNHRHMSSFTCALSKYCTVMWYILLYIWLITFKNKPRAEQWNKVCFPLSFKQARSAKSASFVCRLSITSNHSGQWRQQLNHRSSSSGVSPIVLLFTWSMIVLLEDASQEVLVATAGPTRH